jgi:hypothetical protein
MLTFADIKRFAYETVIEDLNETIEDINAVYQEGFYPVQMSTAQPK